MLTERIGVWDFLRTEVPTYKAITIEFLSSFEFDRASRIMTFNLGGYYHEMHTTALMAGLGFPTEQIENMNASLRWFNDMSETAFRIRTCHDGHLGPQRVKNVLHPTIRYLQRVLSHTLFARGETASVFNAGDMIYVCSMLRRNNQEMNYMPHLAYNLAKHMHGVAHNRQSGGTVRIGGIITKIAQFMQIPTGDDVVEGYTLVDIQGLERARLIKFDDELDSWINLGPDNSIRHRLPLQTPLNPTNYNTWKIVDEPLEPQAPPPPPVLPADPQQAGPQGAAQDGNQFQQLLNMMQTMNANLTGFRTEVNDHFEAYDRRYEAYDRRFEAYDRRFEAYDQRFNEYDQLLQNIETEAAGANHYAREGAVLHPGFEDLPPTPPYKRRAAQRIEERMARERAAAAAAQAQQQAATSQSAEGGNEGNEGVHEDEDEDEEATEDDMDAE